MGNYENRETSGSEYEEAACVFDRLFWGDNVSMCSDGGVK